MMRPIRVLLVDDSPLAVELIRRMLATTKDIVVVGTAANGIAALNLIPTLAPDVICTDLHMPGMDGLTLTREVMTRHPVPILVMSCSLQSNQSDNIFAMLEAGAVDVLAKPEGGIEMDISAMAMDLITKLRVLSGVKVFRRHPKAVPNPIPCICLNPVLLQAPKIIGLGGSTGGPQAFEQVLGALPGNFPLPLLCVQHIAPGFTEGLVKWLDGICEIRIRIAECGAVIEPGTAYFAASDQHVEVDAERRFRCTTGAPVCGHRPSIDLAFRSLAEVYGATATGVLLTGMGQDGAEGLLAIRQAGGTTVAEDASTSVVFGMPRHAIEIGAAMSILPLDEIAPCLLRMTGGRT
jgi:two-component system chemotaxis response regulator CheB